VTHRSWCAEHAGYRSNERLEFLGDAVLGLIVTDDIFRRDPDAGEGQMSRASGHVVCAPGARRDGGRARSRRGAAARARASGPRAGATGRRSWPTPWKPCIGAVYLDGAWRRHQVVARLVGPRLATAGEPDHKSRLHELAAQVPGRRVHFEITEEGPSTTRPSGQWSSSTATPLGEGTGRSKKQAEQAAAEAAWQRLEG
jgi:ribonuclease III